MDKKILKINSKILSATGILSIAFSMLCIFYILSIKNEQTSSYEQLAAAIVFVIMIIVILFNLPRVISGISAINYCEGKNTYKLCMISNIVGIILYSLFVFLFVWVDKLSIFTNDYNGHRNVGLQINVIILNFIIFILPFFINLTIIYKDKNNLTYDVMIRKCWPLAVIVSFFLCISLIKQSIITVNKVKITKNNTHSYYEFESELKSRKLIYDLPKGKLELASFKQISALGPRSEYMENFSSNSESNGNGSNKNKKYPFFVYDSYSSLIKKSNKTASYYYIGPEDWYISWYIYYVNGKIYAAIGNESQYGKGWETSLSTTKYGVVVSEGKNIPIYNSKKNYYVKNGCILDTKSGSFGVNFPTTSDIYNRKCMKIKVVDKVDAKTLNKIAKDLSPQYWKIYLKNR